MSPDRVDTVERRLYLVGLILLNTFIALPQRLTSLVGGHSSDSRTLVENVYAKTLLMVDCDEIQFNGGVQDSVQTFNDKI